MISTYENHSTHSFKNIYTYQVYWNINIFNIKNNANLGPVISCTKCGRNKLMFFCRKKGSIRSSWAENIRDLSENLTGVEFFFLKICSQHLGPSSKHWQNLCASPLRIGRIWVPPYIYVFYGLIWAISVCLIICNWQNLGAPFRRLAKSGCPLPSPVTNSKL